MRTVPVGSVGPKSGACPARRLRTLAVTGALATLATLTPTPAQAVRPAPPTVIEEFGSAGSSTEQFSNARGVAVNWQGDLYVADCGNNRIQHLTTTGTFLDRFGTAGSGNGQFNCPVDVAFAGDGTLLVVDQGNRRIQQFEVDGDFIRAWPTGTSSAGVPWAVDVDEQGQVYVTDGEPGTQREVCYWDWGSWVCDFEYDPPSPHNNKVRRFAADGTPLGTLSSDSANYELRGLWITTAGRAHYVSNGRVRVVGVTGGPSATYGTVGWQATDVAVDRFGHIWVAGGNKVRELDQDGALLSTRDLQGAFGITVDRDHVYATNGYGVTRFGIGAPQTSIVGSVNADDSGAGVAGAHVVALRAGDLGFAQGATTDSAGRYRLEVAPGEYLLQFFDPTGRFGSEWHANRAAPSSLDQVERVTAVTGTEVTVSAGLAPEIGAIRGLLQRSPIATLEGGLVVALRNGVPAGMATSNSGSYYTITGLRRGPHTLVGLEPSGGSVPEFYDNAGHPDDARPVTVSGGGLGVVASFSLATTTPLPSDGTATGTVTEDGTGQPVPGALVVALRQSDLRFVRATTTAADGTYALSLPTGSHYLQIATPTGTHRFEWFDDEADPASFAELTPVSPGTVADAALTPSTGSIRGTITESGTGAPIAGAWVVVGGPTRAHGAITAADGSYTVPGLGAGSYTVVVVDPTAAHELEYHSNASSPAGATPVGVTAAHVTTLDASLDPT